MCTNPYVLYVNTAPPMYVCILWTTPSNIPCDPGTLGNKDIFWFWFWFWRGHLCRTCFVVWFSWPQGQVGEDASFSLRCMWLFSLLCPVRSLTRMTSGIAGGSHPSVILALLALWWESSFHWSWHCWHAVLLWHPLLQGCPLIPQWAGIHCRTALLVAATCTLQQ